jgi:hypothetical protein
MLGRVDQQKARCTVVVLNIKFHKYRNTIEIGAMAAWSCSLCTFENEPRASQCAMCLSARPAATPAKTLTPPNGSSKKARRGKTPPPSKSRTSLLFSVGSSAEKEQQRVRRKLQQLKELGIELPDDEVMALLQRNCFSVPGAASEYFERLARQDEQADGKQDEQAKQRLEQVLEKLEQAGDAQDQDSFQVLGKTTMQAAVNRQGVKLQVGDELLLQAENAGKKRLRPGLSASGGIVRIESLEHAQIGRLERNLEVLLHPLMKSGLVKLGGACKTPPVSSQMFASFDVRGLGLYWRRLATLC